MENLTPWKDRMLVIDGMDFYNTDNHEPGMIAMLTNNGDASSETAGMSLDQWIASKIGGQSRFSSLELGVQTSLWGGTPQTRMSYSAPGELVTPDDNPASVYARLYGDLAGGADAAARLLAHRQSVLDLVGGELRDLQTRLGSTEKAKLDAHLESLRSVERQLSGGGTCTPGTEPSIADPSDNASFPDVTSAQIELAIEALACDFTRVASVQMSHTISPTVLDWAGASDGHHSLSHSDDGNSSGIAQFLACERWFADQVGAALTRLSELPSPDGGLSLLDDTLVLWCKELGDSRLHTCTSVPWVIFGDAGGYFRTGRYVDLGGTFHSKVMVSICEAFGLDNTTFGDPASGSGGAEVLR
jgi:hypothetical protein